MSLPCINSVVQSIGMADRDVVDDGDAVPDLLLQAGTNIPTSTVAAATLTTANLRVVIRGAPVCCSHSG